MPRGVVASSVVVIICFSLSYFTSKPLVLVFIYKYSQHTALSNIKLFHKISTSSVSEYSGVSSGIAGLFLKKEKRFFWPLLFVAVLVVVFFIEIYFYLKCRYVVTIEFLMLSLVVYFLKFKYPHIPERGSEKSTVVANQ